MAESKNGPVLDKKVEKLHKELEEMLGGPQPGRERDEPYWDASSTTFKDGFLARLDELGIPYSDQPVPPGGDRQANDEKANG